MSILTMYLAFYEGDYVMNCLQIICEVSWSLTFNYGWKNWKMLSQLSGATLFLSGFPVCSITRGTVRFFLLCRLHFLFSQYQRTDVPSTLFSSAFLPCICTVFKESFVYVFAIKKKMLLKTKVYSLFIYPSGINWGNVQLSNIMLLKNIVYNHEPPLNRSDILSTCQSQWKG